VEHPKLNVHRADSLVYIPGICPGTPFSVLSTLARRFEDPLIFLFQDEIEQYTLGDGAPWHVGVQGYSREITILLLSQLNHGDFRGA